MFDPERIRRWRPLGDEIMLDTVPGNEDAPRDSEFVLASDYDALLKLYREHVPAVPCYVCGQEAKGTKARVTGTGEPVCMKCYDAA